MSKYKTHTVFTCCIVLIINFSNFSFLFSGSKQIDNFGSNSKSEMGSTFDVEQAKNEIFIELSKNLNGTPKNNPILLLIGGYPGSGKTTLINALTQSHDFSVIRWDNIRQALVDRHIKGSPYDSEILNFVNQNLFRLCLQRSTNIIIDANAYSNNIKLFEKLLETENYQNIYRVLKICLNPPTEVLLSRLNTRKQQTNIHQGTEADLLRDLNSEYKKVDINDYSLIINNNEFISIDTEINIVNSLLKPYFDAQELN